MRSRKLNKTKRVDRGKIKNETNEKHRMKHIYCFPYVSMHNSDFHNEHLYQKIILIDIFRYTRFRRFVKRLCTTDDDDGCGGSKMYRLQNFSHQLPYVSTLFLYIIFSSSYTICNMEL